MPAGDDVSPESITSAMVKEAVEEINRKLSQFDFEVRSGRDQKDRSTVYAFVCSSPLSPIFPPRSRWELLTPWV